MRSHVWMGLSLIAGLLLGLLAAALSELHAIAVGFAVGSLMLPRAAVTPERQAVLRAAAVDPATIQSAAGHLASAVVVAAIENRK